MKYFFDTEFIENPGTIKLISIGIVSEKGQEYYAVNSECDLTQASPWVQENVITKLPPREDPAWKTSNQIKADIVEFVDDKPEFWGWYSSFDWVVFCWLFGRLVDLPPHFPKHCRDIRQLSDGIGNPDLPNYLAIGSGENKHNALTDARWNKAAYEFFTNDSTN